MNTLAKMGLGLCLILPAHLSVLGAPDAPGRHPVPADHPRLLGSRAELRALAKDRAADYARVAGVARGPETDDHSKLISLALVAAIEGDAELGRQAKQRALRFVDGPIRQGHETFGHDLALSAIVYDLGHEWWTEAERARFHEYFNRTVDANVSSETHVFHNGWYGYKNWGIGLAGYACYHENPRAPGILKELEQDFRNRAAPALELAGEGGGWAEGYYIHYWLYEWLLFCEVARRCEGVDYYAMAPGFFRQRALASVFETYPGLGEYGSRRCIPMGDGGGRRFGGDRDKALSARRILVNRFRDEPVHQAIHTFNELTPRSSVGAYAYKDFLWRDGTLPSRPITELPLSHLSAGPGHLYARSFWQDDATYFFFKCGDRFTAHQHLDVGHFLIFKHEELAGDGGHYDDFGSPHDVNFHLRTIAHSTMLVLDPQEKWPAIRAGNVTGNDGGQHHAWRHHNGALADVADWERQRAETDIADLLAFEDRGGYLYVAGDCTRAYSTNKVRLFTRQFLFLRPNTFVVFDRVESRNPDFRKTWLLQAMKKPVEAGPHLVVTHGRGRLFLQSLLPEHREVKLVDGENLYHYGGGDHPPRRDTGPAPECRIEITPASPAARDHFLHVLTTGDADTPAPPAATVETTNGFVSVLLGDTRLRFDTERLGGQLELRGVQHTLAGGIRR